MSTTEETPESSRKRSSYVNDFLESGRKKARTSLSTDKRHIEDLEYMLKSVRVLVKIIDKIWDNCKDHLIPSENYKPPLTFKRDVYKEVSVEKKGRYLAIFTKKESSTKDFGSPPAVPEDLSKLVCFDPPKYEHEYDALPDYNEYIEKSSILCEDVLLPFLTGLKEHLEIVLVFLGKIEIWLTELKANKSFLCQTLNISGGKIMRDKKEPSKIFLYFAFCSDVNSKMESTYNLCTEKGRKGLKAAFDFVKTFEPITQIEVKGAGEKAVNGTYTMRRLHNCVCMYSRSGVWEGKPVTIILKRDQKYKKIWSLYCKDESEIFTFFYWAEGTGENYELPPLDGWRNEGNIVKGVDPSPQIFFKIDD